MRAALLFVCLFVIYCPPLSAYSTVDSLLEEAAFLFQIAGRPHEAAGVYQKILSDFSDDLYAAEIARRRLDFLRQIFPGGGLAPGDVAGDSPSSDPLLLWHRKFGAAGLAGAADGGKFVAAVNSEGFLICLEKSTGNVLWARRGVNGTFPPVCADGMAYAVGAQGNFLGFLLADGKPVFSRNFPITAPLSQPQQDRIFALSGNRALCLRLKTGEEIWSRSLSMPGRWVEAPVAGNKWVLFCNSEGPVVALDAFSGRELWRASVRMTLPPFAGEEWIAFAARTQLLVFQGSTGKTLWNRGFAAPISDLAGGSEGLLVVLTANELMGFEGVKGSERFAFAAGPGRCAAGEGGVYLADERGRVEGRARDGRKHWSHPTGETGQFSLLTSPGTLIVAAENQGLFLFNTRSPLPEDERLRKLRHEIEMLNKSGMTQMASEKIRRALSGPGAGDPELWALWAGLIEKNGAQFKEAVAPAAMEAWEKFFDYADTSLIGRSGVLRRLREVTGAAWVVHQPLSNKFNSFYKSAGEIFLLGEGEVRALDVRDGRLLWRTFLDSESVTLQTAQLSGERLFCAGDDQAYCLEGKTGRVVWRSRLPGRVTELGVKGALIFIGTWNQGGVFLNAETGNPEARVLEGNKALFSVAAGGRLFAVGLEGFLIGYESRRVAFHKQVGDPLAAAPFGLEGGLLLSTAQGFLKNYSARDGALLWEIRPGAQGVSFTGGATRIFGLFSNGALAAIEPQSGRVFWERKTEAEGLASDAEFLAIFGGRNLEVVTAAEGAAFREFTFPGKISHARLENRTLWVRLENGLFFRINLMRS